MLVNFNAIRNANWIFCVALWLTAGNMVFTHFVGNVLSFIEIWYTCRWNDSYDRWFCCSCIEAQGKCLQTNEKRRWTTFRSNWNLLWDGELVRSKRTRGFNCNICFVINGTSKYCNPSNGNNTQTAFYGILNMSFATRDLTSRHSAAIWRWFYRY